MSEVYDEPARTYVGPVITFLVLLAGFGFDALLGGAVAHLPGWIIAVAVVVGAHVLLVRAARSTQSLHLDADELRVGAEALDRDDVVSVAAGVDPGLPVLGWPSGLPKGAKGATVRLRDGRDVVVVSRHPDQLLAALGVATTPRPQDAPVRPATPADLPLLGEIDARASVVFRVAGYELPETGVTLPPPKVVFVIGDPPEAFVWLDEVDGAAYVAEIAVLPGRMRQGLGSRLMRAAEEWARGSGYDSIALTTFADVPWNAPWYRTLGYTEWDDPGPGLAAIRANESKVGLDDAGRRITMRRSLGT